MKDKLPLSQKPALHVIIPMSEQQQTLALLLADNMQAENICTDVILDEGSMKSMMRKANKMQANFVLILGEEEQKTNTVTIKDMQTGESQNIKQAKVVSFLKK